jgi:magnesium chelatase subunit I
MIPGIPMNRPQFPFTALHGQTALRTALLLVAIDPLIGGVLIEGPRGTAKSTAARSLADLLPQGRFVNLPLGASEEQLIGSLDIEDALQRGEANFKPGLLARAHQGVLYVDEINLLPDALVDALLDVSASGVNYVERDGVSHRHEARVVLVGTMNPEEGELRPQLLDRFGLYVRADRLIDPATRQRIVRARLEFDAAPSAFLERHAERQRQLAGRLAAARARLRELPFTDAVFSRVGALCHDARVEGVRADLAMLRAARAHAALGERAEIDAADIDAVAELVLAHRRHPPDDDDSTPTSTPPDGGHAPGDGAADRLPDGQAPQGGPPCQPFPEDGGWGALPPESRHAPPIRDVKQVKPLPPKASRPAGMPGDAKMRAARAASVAGTYRRGEFASARVDWPRTLVNKADRPLCREHLRYRRRAAPGNFLYCLVLDCSASMLRGGALSFAKGLLLRWSQGIYRQRARLAVITFSGGTARLAQPPARPAACNESWIRALAGGGATPVMAAMKLAASLLRRERRRDPGQDIGLWLLTDGRFEALPPRPEDADFCVVVDFEDAPVPLRRAARIAAAWARNRRAGKRSASRRSFSPAAQPPLIVFDGL